MSETKASAKPGKKPKKSTDKSTGKKETMNFQAEVGRLLDIVAHSLYSEREIFLRELISNAADACDRLRYVAIAKPELLEGGADFYLELSADKDAKTLTLADNGSGMTRDEMIGNLGTIARSGTSAFMEKLSGDDKKDTNLIGQFGVGFYSAYMVSDIVEVDSMAAGSTEAWKWVSDGRGEFSVEPGDRTTRGTTITMHLKDDALEFAEDARIQHIVKTYSDHIPFPIKMQMEVKGENDAVALEDTQLNEGSALWVRNKSDIDEQQYKEFYHHVAHAFDDPWATLHFRAEGVIEYSGLVYIPTTRPMDLFHPERVSKLKLYVKRVFITDDCEDLLPKYLRFLRGVIDSEDLPLNVSREMLQNNPVLTKIRNGLTKRVLGDLAKRAENEPSEYNAFWENFGMVLKEGIYEASGERDQLIKLARFNSTNGEELVSLDAYIGRMKEGQDAIYYISGEDRAALSKSPQLEGFKAKGVEVLYMTDPVDEFWIPMVPDFEGKSFKSVTRGGADLTDIKSDDKTDEAKKEDTKAPEGDLDSLIAAIKLSLGENVADVRVSDRLTSSAVCLVAADDAMDMHLERLLKQHQQLSQSAPRVLEINPGHDLIKALGTQAKTDGADMDDAAHLLMDQARILEGETLPDPTAFAARLSSVMAKSFG